MTQLTFSTTKQNIEEDKLWTKQKILSRIGQEEIFEHYLRIPVSYRGFIRSPLRKDDNPTCTFKWIDGKLLFRDWAEERAKDCFDIVKDLCGCDFYTSLEIVAKDFNLTSKTPRDAVEVNYDESFESHKRSKNNEKSIIEVKRQPFSRKDIRYLKRYHLTRKILEYYNVYSIKAMWLNGNQFYVNTHDEPALGYYFGVDEQGRQKWKIYFYERKGSWRFIGNTNRINGWVQIPEKGKLLVITKSLKDVMCLARFGIPAIAMQAEAQIPYDYIIDELKGRFDSIYTLLDFDKTGIRSARKIRDLYGIPYLFFDNRYEEKDFSDYLAAHGLEKTKDLVVSTLKYYDFNPEDFKLPV